MNHLVSAAMDAAMCAMMNRIQWRLRHDTCTRDEFEAYLLAGESLTPDQYFAAPIANIPVADQHKSPVILDWPSPVASGHPENDTARALWFIGPAGPSAPTAIVLHALMSASDAGYRRLSEWFAARGWNMIFPHLPFHYSRVPRGRRNGALAITANLPRNAEGLRQGVAEQRQILAFLRTQGVRNFGLLGTSYGGWTASLLSFVEADFRFLALVQPIIDLEHAIWNNPAAASIRRILNARGITAGQTHRHAHLTSPLHGTPLTPCERITLIGGRYDTVAPPAGLRELAAVWRGAEYAEVRQGHFGFAALEEAKRRLERHLQSSSEAIAR